MNVVVINGYEVENFFESVDDGDRITQGLCNLIWCIILFFGWSIIRREHLMGTQYCQNSALNQPSELKKTYSRHDSFFLGATLFHHCITQLATSVHHLLYRLLELFCKTCRSVCDC